VGIGGSKMLVKNSLSYIEFKGFRESLLNCKKDAGSAEI
jgi:hypothetical protein